MKETVAINITSNTFFHVRGMGRGARELLSFHGGPALR